MARRQVRFLGQSYILYKRGEGEVQNLDGNITY